MITKTKYIDLLQLSTTERIINVREVTEYTDDETGEMISKTNHRSNYTVLDDMTHLPTYVQDIAQIIFNLSAETAL